MKKVLAALVIVICIPAMAFGNDEGFPRGGDINPGGGDEQVGGDVLGGGFGVGIGLGLGIGVGGNASANAVNCVNNENTNTNTNTNKNCNLNNNRNVNYNTARQDQDQGQLQQQQQQQQQNDSWQLTIEHPRGFHNPGDMRYPWLGTHQGKERSDGCDFELANLLTMKPVWGVMEMKEICGKSDINIRSFPFTPRIARVSRWDKGVRRVLSDDQTIKVHMGQPMGSSPLLGVIKVEADDVYTTNVELLAEAALDALTFGADAIYIVRSGVPYVTKSKGWGVGFGGSGAGINSLGDLSIQGHGGTGYSSGEAGYRTKPFLQVMAVGAQQVATIHPADSEECVGSDCR